MNEKLAAGILAAGILFLLMRDAKASQYQGGDMSNETGAGDWQNTPTDGTGADSAPQLADKVAAMLAVIRQFESGNDYRIIYGGGHFDDMTRHPNVRVYFTNPATGKRDFSTAAGAYQINYPTYNEFAPRVGVSDFSVETQDILAVEILRSTGAFQYLDADNLPAAFKAAARRWASLPGSTAQQNPQSLANATAAYEGYLYA